MIIGLDHIAIAVANLAPAIQRFCEDLGLTLRSTETVEQAETVTAFLPIEKTAIELIQPLNGAGPVQKSLDNRGGGLHHLCFRSNNLLEDRDRLKAKGYQFVNDEPQPGAHGSRVLWIHPRSTEGVLIELAEQPE